MSKEEKSVEYFNQKLTALVRPTCMSMPRLFGETDPQVIRSHADAMESYNTERQLYGSKMSQYPDRRHPAADPPAGTVVGLSPVQRAVLRCGGGPR